MQLKPSPTPPILLSHQVITDLLSTQQSEQSTSTSSTLESTLSKPLVDTLYISEIYMQRPTSLAAMGFGDWCNQAWSLEDEVLKYCNTRSAKTLIVQEGYNTLSLDALRLFNQQFKDI